MYLVVASYHQGPVARYADTGHGHIIFWTETVRGLVFTEIIDVDPASSVSADKLSLVWMNSDIVYGVVVVVHALNRACPGIPDFHRTVFRACHHPFAFAMEANTSDVAGVAFECHDSIRIAGLNVVQSHHMPTSGC